MVTDFKVRVRQHAETVKERRTFINTEEATKHSLVMPLLSILGYDVYDPREVVPEFDADVANRKGEKVDYAICINGQPTIFIECKSVNEPLDMHRGQLVRYFQVVKDARFGILTNGVQYRFYTDIEDSNIMDQLPFLEFDLTTMTDDQIEELRKFSKPDFDPEKIHVNASKLKHMNALTKVLQKELEEPSEDFVRLLAGQVCKGRMTASVLEYFQGLVKSVIKSHISGLVRSRLESAMTANDQAQKDDAATSSGETTSEETDQGIVTTQEELDAFVIVKAILAMDKRSRGRIAYRDSKSYFAILLDDNARKPICRMILKENRKRILFFDQPENFQKESGAKTGEVVEMQSIEDIYGFEDRLLNTFRWYEDPSSAPAIQPQAQILPLDGLSAM